MPYLVGLTLYEEPSEAHPYYGYVNEQFLLAGAATIGLAANIWLYIDDKKNRGGNLDKA